MNNFKQFLPSLENIGIVIQGPTTYYKEVVAHYKNIPNVVWSTWNDESASHISYIQQAGIAMLLQTKTDIEHRHYNVNLQCLST